VKDRIVLLTAILLDAINLGLVRTVEAWLGTSLARLSRVADGHIRDLIYSNRKTPYFPV
jgi:hypothetical protein